MSKDFKKSAVLTGSRSFKITQPQKETTNKSKLYEGSQLTTRPKNEMQTNSIVKKMESQTARAKPEGENVEDQYIKGLQDEVKLLEYELKLIKDKDNEEVENFSHFFKFFNDGVPINENIIAMKNLYQYTQKNLEDEIKKITEINEKQKRTQEYLSHDIDSTRQKLDELNQILKQKENEYATNQDKFSKEFFDEKHAIIEQEPIQKELMTRVRDKQTQLMLMNRNEEREKLHAVQADKTKQIEMDKIKKQIGELEQIILEKKKTREDAQDGQQFETKKKLLEEENEILKKKVLSIKNEINMIKVKKGELEFYLESQAQDRLQDFKQIRTLNQQIEDVKLKIDQENKMTETIIFERVREKEKDDIRKIELEIENIKTKQIDVLKERIRKCEDETEKMVYDKVDVSQKILDEEQKKEQQDKQLEVLQQDAHILKIDFDISKMKLDELEIKVEPTETEVKKLKDKIPKLNNEIEQYQKYIDNYYKQLQLITEIKNFNFEEIKMIASTNTQVNSSISTLIKKWENIEMMCRAPEEKQ